MRSYFINPGIYSEMCQLFKLTIPDISIVTEETDVITEKLVSVVLPCITVKRPTCRLRKKTLLVKHIVWLLSKDKFSVGQELRVTQS